MYLESHSLVSFIACKYLQITAYLICKTTPGESSLLSQTVSKDTFGLVLDMSEFMGGAMNTATRQMCPPVGSNLSPWVWEAPPAFLAASPFRASAERGHLTQGHMLLLRLLKSGR